MNQHPYIVKVNGNRFARFPDICIVCEKLCNERNEIKEAVWGYWGLYKWIFLQSERLNVPCHIECIEGLRTNSLKRKIAFISIIAGCVGLTITFNFSRVTMLLILFAAILPLAAKWELKPLSFEFRHEGKQKTYSFKSENYARNFASWNSAKVE